MNLHRVQKKGEELYFQEYDKDRKLQHKNRKATLPKITSPAMMDICEAELPDYTSPVYTEEGVHYRKDDKNEKNDEEKEV